MARETSNGALGRTIARALAVIAIVGAVVALVMVIGGSVGSDGNGGGGDRAERRAAQREQQQNAPETYVVTAEDTEGLSGIAAKTGVPVEKLQDLNPDIDPQALVPGSTLKLR